METLQRTANAGSVSTGYDIDNSLKFEEDNTEMMEQNPSAGGNRRTFTVSLWMKRSEISTTGNSQWIIGAIGASETAALSIDPSDVIFLDVGLGSTRNRMGTTQVFRDTSAWYHLVWRVDTTQGTAADRNRLYVNGVLAPLTAVDGYPTQNFECEYNNDKLINIGHYQAVNNNGLCGYLAEIHSCDGVSNAPTEFGEFDADSGIWKPKAYAGSYGAQGFYLPLDNSSDLGANSKGNSVDFTLQNITSADQATDTPTNNFCTWNPLWVYATQPTISDGATKTFNSSSDWTGAKSTFGLTKGKWYWEYKALNFNALLGIQTDGESNISASGSAQSKLSTLALFLQGEVEIVDSGGSRDDTNVTFTFDAAHTFGIALDMDSSTQIISFYQNGSLITNGGSINIDGLADKTVFPFVATLNNTVTINFGGYTSNSISSAASDANGYGTFEYAPPSGYYALCTKNLAEFG